MTTLEHYLLVWSPCALHLAVARLGLLPLLTYHHYTTQLQLPTIPLLQYYYYSLHYCTGTGHCCGTTAMPSMLFALLLLLLLRADYSDYLNSMTGSGVVLCCGKLVIMHACAFQLSELSFMPLSAVHVVYLFITCCVRRRRS